MRNVLFLPILAFLTVVQHNPFVASLSLIATVAVDGEPKVAPVGLLSATDSVSIPSANESSIMGMVKVLDTSPGAKVKTANEVFQKKAAFANAFVLRNELKRTTPRALSLETMCVSKPSASIVAKVTFIAETDANPGFRIARVFRVFRVFRFFPSSQCDAQAGIQLFKHIRV